MEPGQKSGPVRNGGSHVHGVGVRRADLVVLGGAGLLVGSSLADQLIGAVVQANLHGDKQPADEELLILEGELQHVLFGGRLDDRPDVGTLHLDNQVVGQDGGDQGVHLLLQGGDGVVGEVQFLALSRLARSQNRDRDLLCLLRQVTGDLPAHIVHEIGQHGIVPLGLSQGDRQIGGHGAVGLLGPVLRLPSLLQLGESDLLGAFLDGELPGLAVLLQAEGGAGLVVDELQEHGLAVVSQGQNVSHAGVHLGLGLLFATGLQHLAVDLELRAVGGLADRVQLLQHLISGQGGQSLAQVVVGGLGDGGGIVGIHVIIPFLKLNTVFYVTYAPVRGTKKGALSLRICALFTTSGPVGQFDAADNTTLSRVPDYDIPILFCYALAHVGIPHCAPAGLTARLNSIAAPQGMTRLHIEVPGVGHDFLIVSVGHAALFCRGIHYLLDSTTKPQFSGAYHMHCELMQTQTACH